MLTPLTGAGSFDGPRMLKAMQAVFDEVNKAGGVMGRPINVVIEDDQTNPEAAVRAARKLIEVDKVSVILGTWASAVRNEKRVSPFVSPSSSDGRYVSSPRTRAAA